MKLYLFISGLLFLGSIKTNAQVNLQLSRVITYTGSVAVYEEIILDTVPNGKVWKIEALGVSGFANGILFRVNGKNYINTGLYAPANQAAGSVSVKETLWLKSNDYISYKNPNIYCPYGCNLDYVISILEFSLN